MNDTQRRTGRDPSTFSIELYVRSPTPAPGRRDAVIDRLGALRTDGRIEVLRTPVFCLAAHREGDLAGVFPCSRGDRVYPVGDALDALAAGTLPVTSDPVPASPGDGA